MTDEKSTQSQESALEQPVYETTPITKKEVSEIMEANLELIDTIRMKAQSEAKKLGDFNREAYLTAVRNLTKQVEAMNLFDPDKINDSLQKLQSEAEKNWDLILKQVNDFGDRLNEAAQAAWEALRVSPQEKKSAESESKSDS